MNESSMLLYTPTYLITATINLLLHHVQRSLSTSERQHQGE